MKKELSPLKNIFLSRWIHLNKNVSPFRAVLGWFQPQLWVRCTLCRWSETSHRMIFHLQPEPAYTKPSRQSQRKIKFWEVKKSDRGVVENPLSHLKTCLDTVDRQRSQLESHLICGCLDRGKPEQQKSEGSPKIFQTFLNINKGMNIKPETSNNEGI